MIKLPNTLQEVFDIVSKHLLKQNEKSEYCDGTCMYYGPNGSKCAAGILIPINEYNEEFEGKGWLQIINRKYVEDKFTEEICNLQRIHDLFAVCDWKDELIKFADDYNLQINFEV